MVPGDGTQHPAMESAAEIATLIDRWLWHERIPVILSHTPGPHGIGHPGRANLAFESGVHADGAMGQITGRS